MPAITTPARARSGTAKPVHPVWVRVKHWSNALSVLVLDTSGLRIYSGAPIWPFRVPAELSLCGWLDGALQWHFAGTFLLVGNGLVYLELNFGCGRFVRQLLPLPARAVRVDCKAALRGHRCHADAGRYNAVQCAAYLATGTNLILLVLSGAVLWKSVQFPLLRGAMGSYGGARRVHFVAMAVLLAFVALHLAMVALVRRALVAMLRGRSSEDAS